MMPDQKPKTNSRNGATRVVLVDTSAPTLKASCNGAEAGSKLPYAEKSAGQKALQPGLKGWLDGVILPILIGDIFHDNSGEFNSRCLCDAIRYIRALFVKPAVARVDC
jgi:hypothetical protein